MITAVLVFGTLSGTEWNKALTWDGFGYYYYLPMVFIQKTISLENLDMANQIFAKYDPSSTLYQFTKVSDGRFIIRYSSGQAVLYFPFFLLGHLVATLTDYPTDGFSKPYNVSILFGGLVYHALGIALIGRILLRFYADKIVAVTLVVLFFGTNMYSLLHGTALSSQGSGLLLIAGFITIVDSYYRQKSLRKIFLSGCIFGLICVSRPTDFIAIIPAILWPMIVPGKTVKQELKSLLSNTNHLLAFLIPSLFFAFLQFGYWKYAGGSWFLNSYGNPAEGLDFLSPHTIPFLFSFKSGWLLYTPLMILVLAYLIVRSYKKDSVMQVVLIYTVLFVYLASSWTNWWYGGGFSQRAMCQAYVLLSIPLAGLINYAFFKKHKLSFLPAILIPLFVVLSIWQTKQYHNGVLNDERVTADYYFASFFDLYQNPENIDLLAFSHYDIYLQENYELPDGYKLVKTIELQVEQENQNLEGNEWSKGFSIPYKDVSEAEYCFILFSATFEGSPPKSACLVTVFDHGGPYGYQCKNVIQNLVDTNKVANLYTSTSTYLTPNLRSRNDKFNAYIWNIEKEPAILKALRLEVYIKADLD